MNAYRLDDTVAVWPQTSCLSARLVNDAWSCTMYSFGRLISDLRLDRARPLSHFDHCVYPAPLWSSFVLHQSQSRKSRATVEFVILLADEV